MPDTDPELVLRVDATEATERHFTGKPWRPGSVDCAQLAGFHLKRLGWKLPRVARYRSIEEGRARLAALGCATMADLLDHVGLRRRTPASALVGDIWFLPGDGEDGGIGALVLATGNGACKGFHGDHDGLVTMRPPLVTVAWDVLP